MSRRVAKKTIKRRWKPRHRMYLKCILIEAPSTKKAAIFKKNIGLTS